MGMVWRNLDILCVYHGCISCKRLLDASEVVVCVACFLPRLQSLAVLHHVLFRLGKISTKCTVVIVRVSDNSTAPRNGSCLVDWMVGKECAQCQALSIGCSY